MLNSAKSPMMVLKLHNPLAGRPKKKSHKHEKASPGVSWRKCVVHRGRSLNGGWFVTESRRRLSGLSLRRCLDVV